MAALKLLNNKSSFSISQGFRNYFYCCFPSGEAGTSPTRSTEGVLKADELGKTTSKNDDGGDDDDDGSLRHRRSLIADNFGYESDLNRQPNSTMTLERCERNEASSVSERSQIFEQAASKSQTNEDSTEVVRKGLNSLLAIAEQATRESTHDTSAGNFVEEDKASKVHSTREVQHPSEVECDDAKESTSTISSENKKLNSTNASNIMGGIGNVAVGGAMARDGVGYQVPPLSPSSAMSSATGTNMEVVDGADGHLFDISDLQQNNSPGLNVVSSCGSILVCFIHDSHVNRMTINIKEARDLPNRERGGVNQAQIRTLLLPLRKIRHKTKVVVSNDSTSLFNETFECKVPTDELTSMGLRMRLYGCERLRKDRLIGETLINFTHSNTIGECFWAHLEPRSNLSHGDSINSLASLTHSESDSSTHSLQHGGTLELMLGLAYNGVTGRLSVEVIKGSNFKNAATKRPPDTFVRMELKGPDGERITHSKTTIRRGHPNPLFKETFMFQVAQSQLNDVSLHVSVFVQKSLKRKEMIGWFTMGSTNSSDDDGAHWTSMLESKGEQVCKWHALLEP